MEWRRAADANRLRSSGAIIVAGHDRPDSNCKPRQSVDPDHRQPPHASFVTPEEGPRILSPENRARAPPDYSELNAYMREQRHAARRGP
jgi:hypothetical protein